MAMNRREKKELEDAKVQAAAAVHLRWPEGQKPTPLTAEQIAAPMLKTKLKDKCDRPCVALAESAACLAVSGEPGIAPNVQVDNACGEVPA